jgi:hypothetical protein
MERKPAAYHRAEAARARKLLAEATTPRLKQHLEDAIAQHEQIAAEVESGSEPDTASPHTTNPPQFHEKPPDDGR